MLPAAEDPRRPIEKLRRIELRRLAAAWNVSVPHDAPATVMRDILTSHGVDPMRAGPNGKAIEWQAVPVKQIDGSVQTRHEPIRRDHVSANRSIDYDAEIRARAEAAEKVEDENEALKKRIADLEERLSGMVESRTMRDTDINDLRSQAKRLGLPVKSTHKKSDIIRLLESHSGQDATSGGQ